MDLRVFLKDRFLPLLDRSDRVYNLTGSSAALLLALEVRPFVAIEKDSRHAETLKGDIATYRSIFGGGRLLFIPDAEGPERSGERAEVLLLMLPADSLVTSFENLEGGFWDREFLQEQLIRAKRCQQYDRAAFQEAVVELGYRKAAMVVERGEYSQREWIIDLFPSTLDHPVRIEFFGDEIDRIRIFDLETQTSVKDIDEITVFPAQEPELSWGFIDIAGDRRSFCLFTREERGLVLERTTYLSRYSFVSGTLPDEETAAATVPITQIDAGILSVRGLGILPDESRSLDDLPAAIAGLSEKQLEVLELLRKMPSVQLVFSQEEIPEIQEVDEKLVELARRTGAKLVTHDYNLNKIATLRGVEVLNLNDLAHALRPVVLPGETLRVSIAKEGKEPNQGVAYLEDGTMVVVDQGRGLIGHNVDIVITSSIQTAAGKHVLRHSPPRAPLRCAARGPAAPVSAKRESWVVSLECSIDTHD